MPDSPLGDCTGMPNCVSDVRELVYRTGTTPQDLPVVDQKVAVSTPSIGKYMPYTSLLASLWIPNLGLGGRDACITL